MIFKLILYLNANWVAKNCRYSWYIVIFSAALSLYFQILLETKLPLTLRWEPVVNFNPTGRMGIAMAVRIE